MQEIDEAQFTSMFEEKLGDNWKKALAVFQNFGKSLAFDVTNVLLHAYDQDKVEQVLEIMEEHYKKDLSFQHPEIRGSVSDLLGGNPTQAMFSKICVEVLQLEPTQ